MKTGKNKRLLASILAASMLLAMSPFALALADGTEDTTNQTGPGQSQSTEGGGGGESAPGSVQLLPAAPVEETGAEENALTAVPDLPSPPLTRTETLPAAWTPPEYWLIIACSFLFSS